MPLRANANPARPAENEPPQQTTYSASEGRKSFPDLLQRAHYLNEVVAFERHGTPVGALVPIKILKMIARGEDLDEATKKDLAKKVEQVLDDLKKY